MKLSVQRQELLKPLQMVIGVVERKHTLPILANILLYVHSGELFVVGTDSEVELIGRSQLSQQMADVEPFTIPGRKLFDICRALPEDSSIELIQERGRVVLRSGPSRFTLLTLSAAEFPNIEEHSSKVSVRVSEQNMRHLLQRTGFAVAQQDVRSFLNGMLIEIGDRELNAVGADGHRLAANCVSAAIEPVVEMGFQAIMPRKSVIELQRLLNDVDSEITLSLTNHYIRVLGKDFTLTSKLIDAKFPDYRSTIPKGGDKVVYLEREGFRQALNRSAILCHDKIRVVHFSFQPQLLRILTSNPEQEGAEEELAIDYHQENFDLALNVNYLLDILNVIVAPQIKLTLNALGGGVLLEEVNGHQQGIFVLMPIRA